MKQLVVFAMALTTLTTGTALFAKNNDSSSEKNKEAADIPKMIQELVFDKVSAQNFDQAQPAQKWPPIRNRGHFCGSKLWDAGDGKNQFLNHFRYNSKDSNSRNEAKEDRSTDKELDRIRAECDARADVDRCF